MKKSMKKMIASIIALTMMMAMNVPQAFAATAGQAVIDTGKTGSLTIYKYDETAAGEAGLVTGSYVATGKQNAEVENVYKNYAIQGVEFTYLKVGEIATYSEVAGGKSETKVVYGLTDTVKAQMESLGLKAVPQKTEGGLSFYLSDDLIDVLATSNQNNPVATKNVLESFVANNGGTAMTETDASGKTNASNLPLGLYLVVETKVPEQVTTTTAPFFVSVPMTDLEGDNWMYDVVVYPKNQTGMPDMVSEAAEITSAGSLKFFDVITASEGDVTAFRLTSHLPMITSKATYLTKYTFDIEMGEGLSFDQTAGVTLSWFSAEDKLIDSWKSSEKSSLFAVEYGDRAGKPYMTISMTDAGFAKINPEYSGYKLVIDYQVRVNSGSQTIYGDGGNVSNVTLEWRRSNMNYTDTLTEENRVYTYGLDMTKKFSDDRGDATEVKFLVYNLSDGYYVTAQAAAPGLYYVTGTVDAQEADATVFSPAADGSLQIFGLENDAYVVTEIETDAGYNLLKDSIDVVITAVMSECENTFTCTHDVHHTLAAEGTVNGKAVSLSENNAAPQLIIVNERGFTAPETGDHGTFILPVAGFIGAAGMIMLVVMMRKKEEKA